MARHAADGGPTVEQRSSRRDYRVGSLHLIVRPYQDSPQFGCLLWSYRRRWTFDIWAGQTLWTVRKASQG
jgi:hypothetical protein